MPAELFRTDIVTRDPRYPSIITICNYALAALFLGMFLTLSGVMLTAFEDRQTDSEPADSVKHRFTHIFGITLLVSGCLLILFAIATFLVASLMYLKTTTSPPTIDETGETAETVWSYLDNLPEKPSKRQQHASDNQQHSEAEMSPTPAN